MGGGTVTGRNAVLGIVAHAAGQTPIWAGKAHGTWGIGEFSMTIGRSTVEQSLIGRRGNYFTQGSISLDGSLTAVKFAAAGFNDQLDNLINAGGGQYYISISGTISSDTDNKYLRFCLASCQITNYEVSIGDADTITELSCDWTEMAPYQITCSVSGLVRD